MNVTMEPTFTYFARVERWVDGDTVWLTVDLGFRITARTDFRLYGINTPERNQPGYAEANARVNILAPAGTIVPIKTYKNPDKYGRWLVDIYTPDQRTLNGILISEGLAVPYFGGSRT
ncbi:thermonuclease family protein [Cryobacterium fucosi]|uniref:Nuclease n=1 Tax=Cryobacterium fucosi TaxID=1259157 RepID=A0A4R9B2K8_9MICO|nr:thermonuclease family protein [Cryobacterium fucosi]TFD74723.1 nuclease [Cryobacterium fucosi]